VSPVIIDHPAARALAYRQRAIELATEAKGEDDPAQRRFLVDKPRALVNVADAIDPPPPQPDEPQVFSRP
jgi:type II secretory pathway component HofQ